MEFDYAYTRGGKEMSHNQAVIFLVIDGVVIAIFKIVM